MDDRVYIRISGSRRVSKLQHAYRAFAKGQLFIDEMPPEDYSIANGNRYLYFGPLPALIRLPVRLLLGRGIPTGLMIVLFCAGSAVLFALAINELTLVQESSDSLLKTVFIILFIFNGYSLLITLIPSIHHEAIAAAPRFFSCWPLVCS